MIFDTTNAKETHMLQRLSSYLWPIDSIEKIASWGKFLVAVVLAATVLAVMLHWISELVNYAWGVRFMGDGLVDETHARWNEPQSFADSEGYAYESPGHMWYQIRIKWNGRHDEAYVTGKQFARLCKGSPVTFTYVVGRINRRPKIIEILC